jgi:hypothetical protein
MALSDRFNSIGRSDAEHLAERLVLRNRDADDRRMCVECLKLRSNGLCGATASSRRRFEPIPNILMRCVDFSAAAFTSR